MRITLPVQPRLKTMSDHATIEYVCHHTDIPAPRALHYNALRDDELDFEWMFQDRVPGTSLKEAWHKMRWLEKELLVRKVTVYLTQLFRKRFTCLGNIYATRDLQKLSEADLPDAMLLSADHSTGITYYWVLVERGRFDPFLLQRSWICGSPARPLTSIAGSGSQHSSNLRSTMQTTCLCTWKKSIWTVTTKSLLVYSLHRTSQRRSTLPKTTGPTLTPKSPTLTPRRLHQRVVDDATPFATLYQAANPMPSQ